MLHAVMMRRRLCGKLHGGLSYLLFAGPARHRSIANYISPTIAICVYLTDPAFDAPVGKIPV